MALFFRIVVFFVIIYVCYKFVRFLFDPKRKIDEAYKHGHFYFYDDTKNVRKNFFITYKGVMFEGEKYLNTSKNASDSLSIFVSVHNLDELHGLTKDDVLFLQEQIIASYPEANISWVKSVEKLLS